MGFRKLNPCHHIGHSGDIDRIAHVAIEQAGSGLGRIGVAGLVQEIWGQNLPWLWDSDRIIVINLRFHAEEG
jgi:hypothetical protein